MFVEVYYVMGWQWLPSISDDPQVRGVITNLPQVLQLKRSLWSRACWYLKYGRFGPIEL